MRQGIFFDFWFSLSKIIDLNLRFRAKMAKTPRPICTHEGCTNFAKRGGVCVSHGATQKRCSHEGCTNSAIQGGVCVRHGAKRPICTHEGCNNLAKRGGVCVRHGATKTKCSRDGCTRKVVKGGICIKHGAKTVDDASFLLSLKDSPTSQA